MGTKLLAVQRFGLVWAICSLVGCGPSRVETTGGGDAGATSTHGDSEADSNSGDGASGAETLDVTTTGSESDGGGDEEPAQPWHAAQICAGGWHNCARSVDGRAKCWGNAEWSSAVGQGQESVGDDESVASVDDLFDGGVVAVGCGRLTACALLDDGRLHCWGRNNYGQLGHGHDETVGDDEPLGRASLVALDGAVVDFSIGEHHTCAVLENGALRCWGEYFHNALGVPIPDGEIAMGDDEPILSGPAVDVPPVIGVGTGAFSSCAFTAHGDVYCWGGYDPVLAYGEAGHGSSSGSALALPSQLGPLPLREPVVAVGSGLGRTCARSEDWTRCWGELAPGSSGADMLAARSPEVDVGGEIDRLWVALSGAGACFRRVDDEVFCFGSNTYAQLGVGHRDPVIYAPGADNVPLSFGNETLMIALGERHGCVLLKSGLVLCYGVSQPGVLGRPGVTEYGAKEVPQTSDAFAVFAE